MTDSTSQKNKLGNRQKIGLATDDVKSADRQPAVLSKRQQALRQVVINHFKANKVRMFIAKQVQHVNANRQVSEGIKFLFDENGQPPENAPLEDIIAERKKIEVQIRWFEAMSKELANKLVKIKEIEEMALEHLEQEKNHD